MAGVLDQWWSGIKADAAYGGFAFDEARDVVDGGGAEDQREILMTMTL